MNVSLLPYPKRFSGRWILVPFGDTFSQTNVLSFARINVVSPRIEGGVNCPPDSPSRTPMGEGYVFIDL